MPKDKQKNINFLTAVFNIRPNEWKNITLAWTIRFLYKFGFVIGWSVLVVLFVSNFGIKSLPVLFVLNAAFSVLGTLFYSLFVDKISNTAIMIWSVFLSGLFLSTSMFFYDKNIIIFLSILIVSIAVFLNQFKITLNGYTEELFNASQSERAFPFIEASETIAGILAGLTVVMLSNGIETPKFIYLLIASIFSIVPLLLLFNPESNKVTLLRHKKRKTFKLSVFNKWKSEMHSKEFNFVKSMALLVMLQWLIFNLLEFQYTIAVHDNISHVILDTGSGFEHAFIHDLGTLFVIFSSSALLIQLIIGSRIITSLGVIGSMILHFVVTFFSFIGLTISYNFVTAVYVKNNYTMTNALSLNAYHSSYYALKEHNRPIVREFLEGIVKPLGALFGTSLLLVMQIFLNNTLLTNYINFLLLFSTLVALYISLRQKYLYTRTAAYDLIYSKNKKDRINAIDILSQKGHKYSLRYFKKILLGKNESISVKIRILNALKELKDDRCLDFILPLLKSDSKAIRYNTLDTIAIFKILKSKSKQEMHLKYKIIKSLKTLYKIEESPEVIYKIIDVMSKINGISTIEFLLDILINSHGQSKTEAIRAVGEYGDNNLLKYITPYLNSRSINEKTAAIITLTQFDETKDEALKLLKSYMNSESPSLVNKSIYIIGELKLYKYKKFVVSKLKSTNLNHKTSSAIALAKMNFTESIPVLVDLLFDEDLKAAKLVYLQFKKVDVRIYKKVAKIIKDEVENKIQSILESNGPKNVQHFDLDRLLNLKWYYRLVEEYEEVELINNIIKSKQ